MPALRSTRSGRRSVLGSLLFLLLLAGREGSVRAQVTGWPEQRSFSHTLLGPDSAASTAVLNPGAGTNLVPRNPFLDFGRVPVGGSGVRNVFFMNRGATPLVLDSAWIEGDGALFRIAGDVRGVILPPTQNVFDTARMLRMSLVFSCDTVGLFNARLRLRSVDGDTAEMQLVTGSSEDVRLEPDELYMGMVPVDSLRVVTDTITILNGENGPLAVDNVVTWVGGDAGAFVLFDLPEFVPPNSRSRRFGVAFRPGAPRHYETSAFLYLRGTGNFLRLRLSGDGRVGRPRLEWLDSNVRFDPVPFGVTSAPTVLRLVNRGELATDIDTVVIAGGDSASFVLMRVSGPRRLRPGALDTLHCEVAFAPLPSVPSRPGRIALLVVRSQQGGLPVRMLEGEVSNNGPSIDPPRLVDFDSALVNSIDTLAGGLAVGAGGTSLRIVDVEVHGPDSSAFGVVGPLNRLIPSGGTTRFDLTFHPDGVRLYRALLVLRLEKGQQIRVGLQGRGVEFVRGTRLVWIDRVSADVNRPFVLGVHVTPPLTADDNVQRASLKIVVDRRALHFLGADDPELQVDIQNDTLFVDRTGPAIVGDELAALRFEGLVTGQPSNAVAFVAATLDPLPDSLQRLDGLVLLNGCDVGRGVLFGRSAHVVGITPQPAGGVAALRYVAPEGSLPSLLVVDAVGQVQRRLELPAGTGAEQTGEVRLDDLPSGLYLLELRVGSQRSSMTVVIGDR